MKLPALMAIFMPWFLLAVAILAQNLDQPGAVERAGLIWLAVSPVMIALSILVAYREGQWSVKK